MIKINITSSLLSKLNIMSTEYNIELGGYLVGEIKNGEIYLQDILVPNQIITGVSINIRPEDQIELLKLFGDKCKKIIGKWHSHHSMGAFWSSTDKNDINGIMEYKDLYVFIVSSLGNHLIKVCMNNPIKYIWDDVILFPKTLNLDLFRNKINKLVKKNINEGDVQMLNNGESENDTYY